MLECGISVMRVVVCSEVISQVSVIELDIHCDELNSDLIYCLAFPEFNNILVQNDPGLQCNRVCIMKTLFNWLLSL
jgi:hypothetical protein